MKQITISLEGESDFKNTVSPGTMNILGHMVKPKKKN